MSTVTPTVGKLDTTHVRSVGAARFADWRPSRVKIGSLRHFVSLRRREKLDNSFVLSGLEKPSVPRAYFTMRMTVSFHSTGLFFAW